MRRLLIGIIFLAVIAGGVFFLARLPALRKPARPAQPSSASALGKNEMLLKVYFPKREGTDLVEEKRAIRKTEDKLTQLNALLAELHKGPVSADSRAIFPPDTFPRTIFLSQDGTLYINYHPKVLETPLGPYDEIMLVRSIAKSLIYNFPDVKALVILVSGASRHNLGLHLPARGRYILPQIVAKKR